MMLEKQYSAWSNMRFILSETWSYNKYIFLYNGFFTLITAVQPFIMIIFPKLIIDELTQLQRVPHLTLLLLLMFIISSVIGFFTPFLLHRGKTEIMKVTFRYIHRLTAINLRTKYENTENPSFLNKMESARRSLHNVNAGFQGTLNNLFAIGGSVISFFGFFAILAVFNVYILLYLIVSVVISYLLALRMKKYEYSKNDEISSADRKSGYAYNVMSDFSYGKDIRIYNIAGIIGSLYQTSTVHKTGIIQDIQQRYFQLSLVDIVLALFREGIIYGYLIYLYLDHGLTIGNFLLYFATVSGFASWMQTVMNSIAHIRGQNMYIDDLRNFLQMEPDSMPTNQENNLLPKRPYCIEFKHVSFKYANSDQYILQDISMVIEAEQKVAIVGHNGAGKTTLIKLLCRLYEPSAGEILLNGVNIRTIPIAIYNRLLATVFQDIKILAFTVEENVAVKEGIEIDDHKVIDCLDKVGLKEKVMSLSHGVRTPMLKFLDDRGVELSGGENQKLAFARALYKEGDMIMMDEPTAALDALAEQKIYTNFDRYVQGKTSLYISHRLSSTRFCDIILFLENGRLVEYGTHQELLDERGKYFKMFSIQACYYMEGTNR
jgi:ABC-type multidrug transport system fused ATPase/permease subunit